MEVRHTEGVANHSGPESCARIREGAGEALTGERTGQPLSREISGPECRHVQYRGRRHHRRASASAW